MAAATGPATSAAGRAAGPWRTPGRLQAHAAITAAVFVCYILGRLLDAPAFAAVGASACGWSWLLARALFDPGKHDAWWPRVVVGVVVVAGAASTLAPGEGAIWRAADNVYALSGSAALLLTFVEPFNRYRPGLPAAEKRFRFAFLLVYALLIAVSLLDFRLYGASAEAGRIDLVKSACALVGLVAAGAATGFRLRRPLAVEGPPTKRAPTVEDEALAERLMRLLRDEDVHLEPELRIGDVAARLGCPEYRLSQCISALGFRNFNRLINHHRIDRAKRRLADPLDDRSILEIAFECGFASIGPFNRAFRDETGAAPRAFRAARRRAAA